MEVPSPRHLQQRSHGLCTWKTATKTSLLPTACSPRLFWIFRKCFSNMSQNWDRNHSFTSAVFKACQNPKCTTHTRTYRDATCYSVILRRKWIYRLPYQHSAAKGFTGSYAVILQSVRTAIAPSELHGNTQKFRSTEQLSERAMMTQESAGFAHSFLTSELDEGERLASWHGQFPQCKTPHRPIPRPIHYT